jgi:uncharacterized protein (DUF433 family)
VSSSGYTAEAPLVARHADLKHNAQMDLTLTERITINPVQCGGRPCVRGMRIRVTDVLDLLASGLTAAQVLTEMPDLEPPDIEACLRFAG